MDGSCRFFLLRPNVPGRIVIAKSASHCTKTGALTLVLSAFALAAPLQHGLADEPRDSQELKNISRDSTAIIRAFNASHDGYSTDELIIRDDLRERFLEALSSSSQGISPAEERAALLRLLNLRKAGKLNTPATRRGEPSDQSLHAIAEIAARAVTDRHRITTDTMLADPDFRRELQAEAELISPGINAYSIRKSVLALRKQRRLRPELVLLVADWDRKVQTYSLQQLRRHLEQGEIPDQPGVYLFRSAHDYLYIGEAAKLAERLREHIHGQGQASLSAYLSQSPTDPITVELHIFPSDSPAKRVTVRRAYESELIRSRNPRFNIRP